LHLSDIFFDSGVKHDKALKRAFVAGAAIWSIIVAALSLVIINNLFSRWLIWLADLFTADPNVFVTASSFTFIGLFVFYLAITCHRRSKSLSLFS